MRQRGFEIVSAYAGQGIHIPSRKTAKSAGYDLEAAETKVLAPHAVTVVPTGLKAYMGDDEYLSVFIRSSLAFKKVSCLLTARALWIVITIITPTMKGIL